MTAPDRLRTIAQVADWACSTVRCSPMSDPVGWSRRCRHTAYSEFGRPQSANSLAVFACSRSLTMRCPNRQDSRSPRMATSSPPKRSRLSCVSRLPGCTRRHGGGASRTFGLAAMSAIGATFLPPGWISLKIGRIWRSGVDGIGLNATVVRLGGRDGLWVPMILRACQPTGCV